MAEHRATLVGSQRQRLCGLLPQGTQATLPRTYILPGEALAVKVEGPLQGLTGIEIQPATIYGFSVENYRAPITADGG